MSITARFSGLAEGSLGRRRLLEWLITSRGPDIQGPPQETAHGKLMGKMIPERGSRDWINSARRGRMEDLLDDWSARLLSYLALGNQDDRPILDLWAKTRIRKPVSSSDFPDAHGDGYFALSYVWGDASVQKEIGVEGRAVQVG